jgi:hypothetical protein
MMQLGMLEGAMLRHFEDECLIVFLERELDDFSMTAGIPFHPVIISPTVDGKPVAAEIANFILSIKYLVSLFAEELRDMDLLEFEQTEFLGYPSVSLVIAGEPWAAMVDADGYFFSGELEGIEAALNAFNLDRAAYSAPDAANLYGYVNFNRLYDAILVPMYEMYVDPCYLGPCELLEGGLGDFIKIAMVNITELLAKADSTVWRDGAIRFTGDGLDIEVSIQSDLADLALVWIREIEVVGIEEIIEYYGGPWEMGEPPEREETEAWPEDIPSGALF